MTAGAPASPGFLFEYGKALDAAFLPELAATDIAGYVRIAAELAQDVRRLEELRAGLRGRMERSPLMDATGFTRAIEAEFRSIWRKWCAGR